MSVNAYFPVQVQNNTGIDVKFDIWNPDSVSNAFIHFDYNGEGHGHYHPILAAGSSISGFFHIYSHEEVSVGVSPDEPGHIDVSPGGSAGGGTAIMAAEVEPDGPFDLKVTGNLIFYGNNYDGDYSFGVYYDAEGQNPVPQHATINPGMSLYYILS